MKKKKLKIIYESLWDTATLEQKRDLAEGLNRAYDVLFRKVVERRRRDIMKNKQ